MKKFIYGFLIFFVSLMILIVVAANSSFVIKKVADVFAPDYNISYSDIRGNVFTGVKIDGMKFGDMNISKQIRFSWNPSKILYKRIAITEVAADDIDVDTIKALIASFSTGEENNSTSAPFPLVVTVGKVHVSVNPFTEQGIRFEKTVLDAEDISYAVDEIEVGDVGLQLDTNLTKVRLHAALEDGTVKLHSLDISDIDSEALQAMFLSEESKNAEVNASQEMKPSAKTEDAKPMNPLIPKVAEMKHFSASLKPRKYMDASIDRFSLKIDDVKADIVKILENKIGAIEIGKYLLSLQSDVGQVKVAGSLLDDTVMLDEVSAVKIDTLALKKMFSADSNESNTTVDVNTSKKVSNLADSEIEENHATEKKEQKNALIPQKVVLKKLHTDILPAVYDPVHIHGFVLEGKQVVLDVPTLIIQKGEIDLHGQTNMSNIEEHGTIKNNHLDGHIILTPNQHLFDFYKLPLRKKAIGDVTIDFTASKEKFTVDMDAKAKHILVLPQEHNVTDSNMTDTNVTIAATQTETNATEPFNIDINQLAIHIAYDIQHKKADATLKVNVTTSFAKESTLDARFTMDGKMMAYEGALKAGKLEGFDAKLLKPLEGLQILFNGDEKQVKTTIDSVALTGYFNVPDFTQKGQFHLETKSPVALREMVTLPEVLQEAKVSMIVDVPLNFEKLDPITGKVHLRSNLADVDADISYGKKISVDLLTTVPKDSLLKHLDRNIQWNALSPLKLTAKMDEKNIKATLKSSKLSADMQMYPFQGKVDGTIRLAGLNASLKTDENGDIVIKSDVDSFQTLFGTVNQFYHVEKLPKVEGKLNVAAVIKKNSDATLILRSPTVIYHADRKTTHKIDDVMISLGIKGGNTLLLKAYQLTYNKMKFFATKPSEVQFEKEVMHIPQLWLNDQLKVTGKLNTKTMQGEILANASQFHLSHELINLDSRIDLRALFKGIATDINGKITLLGGDIHYNLDTKSFPSDSDILIVQEMKKKEPSPFMDNMTIKVTVDTQKPLLFQQGPIDVKANVNLSILKAINSDPMVLGSVDIVDGSSYTFQGKRFVLERSHIYFTGDPTKPMLDITVKYQALRHLITINVTGTPAVPNILFSSVPSLTKEQILSIILFDSEELAGNNNANDMMKMMGGAMAKSALNDMGVKIDHLVIGEGNSVEVGKKINDKTTVIYINGEVPKMQVRYEYSPSVEVVLGASEESESLDVVYIKDFNLESDDEDIVIKGR